MHTEAEKLYNASVARIVTGRSYQELDLQSKDYWCWKWRMLNKAFLTQEHERMTPAPPPLPASAVERVSWETSPVAAAKPKMNVPALILTLLLILLVSLGGYL